MFMQNRFDVLQASFLKFVRRGRKMMPKIMVEKQLAEAMKTRKIAEAREDRKRWEVSIACLYVVHC